MLPKYHLAKKGREKKKRFVGQTKWVMEFGARAMLTTAHTVIGGHWSHLRVTCYNDDTIQW